METLLDTDLEQYTENEPAKCAANIALYNFNSRYETLVLFNSSFLLGVELFLILYSKCVIVEKNGLTPSTAHESTKQYVIFGTDVLNIAQMLAEMRTRRFDNTGKFVIICESNNACNEDAAADVLWEYEIINVVFIRKDDAKSVIGFTYLVYDDGTCTKKVVNMENLNGCAHDNEKECENMYPVKFKNFNKCELIVSTFVQAPFMWINEGVPEGADGDLLAILGAALNASLTVRTPNEGDGWGNLDDNGRWLGSLGDVYYDLANFSMTSPAFTISRTEYFQSSIDYNACNVIWVTHPAYLKPSWLKLFRPFTPRTFMIFAIIYIFIVTIVICSKSIICSVFVGHSKGMLSTNNIIFYSWSICMGLPIANIPKINALMYVVECWVLYCFLIRTFYQASLISALKYDVYYPEFNTIEEVFNANYPFGGAIALRDYFVDDPDIYNSWIGINTTEIIPTLKNLSSGMEFVLAMNRETARFYMKTERKNVHIFTQNVIRSPTGLLFKKYSPLLRSVNRILRFLVESGITQKLFKDYTHVNKIEGEKIDEPFTTAHYSGCYVILAFGWTLSMLTLVIEMIVFRCKIRIKRNK